MFFLVIVMGLFHGLILLPIVLSLAGPTPYRHYTKAPTDESQHIDDVGKSNQKKQCAVVVDSKI